jgi:hypothetical protein
MASDCTITAAAGCVMNLIRMDVFVTWAIAEIVNRKISKPVRGYTSALALQAGQGRA